MHLRFLQEMEDGHKLILILIEMLTYMILGLSGGYLREWVLHREKSITPRAWENGKTAGWDTGYVGALIAGAILGFIAYLLNQGVMATVSSAIAAPHLVEEVMKHLRTAHLKKNGNGK